MQPCTTSRWTWSSAHWERSLGASLASVRLSSYIPSSVRFPGETHGLLQRAVVCDPARLSGRRSRSHLGRKIGCFLGFSSLCKVALAHPLHCMLPRRPANSRVGQSSCASCASLYVCQGQTWPSALRERNWVASLAHRSSARLSSSVWFQRDSRTGAIGSHAQTCTSARQTRPFRWESDWGASLVTAFSVRLSWPVSSSARFRGDWRINAMGSCGQPCMCVKLRRPSALCEEGERLGPGV